MLTLYHSPMSRSSRIVTLIEELGAEDAVAVRTVNITRADGSGGPDAGNPHPEKKVPALDHDGTVIVESIAIAQHLCELFPDAGMLPPSGTPDRAKCLEWLAWYAGVVEPVVVAKFLNIENPGFRSNFRGWQEVVDRLSSALKAREYLVGDSFSVADLIVSSLFRWMPDLVPDDAGIRGWVERCNARPASQNTMARDSALATVE
ncbi:glutathione S-transferase family protein [Sagittula stellata]|nr:glutathione S-transferase family protein [Sagittula stellata]